MDATQFTPEELVDLYQDTGAALLALQDLRKGIAIRLKALLPELPGIDTQP